MKKYLLALTAVATTALLLTSCGDNGDDGAMPQAFNDSLSIYAGRAYGAGLNRDLHSLPQQMRDSFSTSQFMDGLQYALNSPEGESFLGGLNMGLRIKAQIAQWEAQGAKIDRQTFLNNLRSLLEADSVPDADEITITCNVLQNRLNERSQARRMARLAESPEAKKGIAQGEALIKRLRADSGYLLSPAGIAYKITRAGDTAKTIGADTSLTLTYSVTTADGKTVDQGTDVVVTPSHLPQGMAQAVRLLHPGGEGIFYIPGPLAYGPEGVQGLLAPNQLIIFKAAIK